MGLALPSLRAGHAAALLASARRVFSAVSPHMRGTGAAGGAWVRRMAADASSSRCPRHRARLWDTTLIALVVVQWRDRRGGRCGISGCGGALCEGI